MEHHDQEQNRRGAKIGETTKKKHRKSIARYNQKFTLNIGNCSVPFHIFTTKTVTS